MSEQNPNPVLVAVGHDPIDAALQVAAGEAEQAGCGLHLVHVVHLLAQGPEMALVAETDLERAGRQALNGALELARDLVPASMPVTCELRVGGVVPTLVELTSHARMIVLEHRDLSRVMRVVTRSVTSGVAAHARVPVISVPSRWSPNGRPAAQQRVTVGVDVPERSTQVLRTAAAAARSRGASLHVLHTWSFPSAYDDIVMSRTENDEWAQRTTAEIQAVLDSLGDRVVDVPVHIEARHARAADALVEASKDSALLVIGRHDALVPVGSHLGPIARAMLVEAECPVLLADAGPARRLRRHPEKVTESAPQPA
jgi:nucleotide-binding universal stress UspA family protein